MHSVELKALDVYGRILFYPQNDTAKKLLALVGRKKTFVHAQVEMIRELGFKVYIQ